MPPRVLASGPKPCGGNEQNNRLLKNLNGRLDITMFVLTLRKHALRQNESRDLFFVNKRGGLHCRKTSHKERNKNEPRCKTKVQILN